MVYPDLAETLAEFKGGLSSPFCIIINFMYPGCDEYPPMGLGTSSGGGDETGGTFFAEVRVWTGLGLGCVGTWG